MERIITLAQSQGGAFTITEATDAGIHPNALTAWARSGSVTRPLQGVYLLPDADRTPESDLALRTNACLRKFPGALASHESALALLDVPLLGTSFPTVHLAADRGSSRSRPGLHWHVLYADDFRRPNATQTVDAGLAALQVAATRGLDAGVVALDAALHQGLTCLDAVDDFLLRGRIRRGSRTAKAARERCDARAESPGESLLRLRLGDLGIPVEPQVVIDGPGFSYRVDFLAHDVAAIEFDGAVKYSGAEGREALMAEKLREDRLRSLGYGVARITWGMLRDPGLLHITISRALRGATRSKLRDTS